MGKSPRKNKRYPYSAILPPRKPGDPTRTLYYRTKKEADRARKNAWQSFKANESKMRLQSGIEKASCNPIRCNQNERNFIRDAVSNGIQLHRNGWPDFLCQDTDGRLFGVEVKHPKDFLSPEQIQCFRLLSQAGVCVYVWRSPEKGMVPWEEDVSGRPARERGCLSGQASHEKLRKEAVQTSQHANLAPDEQTLGELAPLGAMKH